MNKAIHYFVILSMLFCPCSLAQAVDPASASSSAVQQSLNKNRPIYKTQNSNRYDPDNPSYYNSLRWLVYALILFLPFSSPEALSRASKSSGTQVRGSENSL